jgi:hypothetical protein
VQRSSEISHALQPLRTVAPNFSSAIQCSYDRGAIVACQGTEAVVACARSSREVHS